MENTLVPQSKTDITNPDDQFAMQMIIQSAQTYQLLKLRRLEESKIPISIKPMIILVVGSYHLLLDPPWIGFDLTNNGPGSISLWINNSADPDADGIIVPNQIFAMDMVYPIINEIYFKSVGGVSVVNIIGKEGSKFIR